MTANAVAVAVQASNTVCPDEPYSPSTVQFFMYHHLEGYMRLSSVQVYLPPVTNVTNNNEKQKVQQ